MSRPVVAIVGRPNVGKSTLFNALAGERISIVKDTPGVTRDRIYADVSWLDYNFTMIDTGGIEPESGDVILSQMREQAQIAIDTADVIIFITDVKQGLVDSDSKVADMLRRSHKPVVLVVNKVDSFEKYMTDVYEFYNLGIGDPHPISAASMLGLGDMLDEVVKHFPDSSKQDDEDDRPRVAIVGKPNVGKSSLINKLAREDRVIVSDIAGTTRDAIDTAIKYDGKEYIFIDTAGLRRKNKIKEDIERYSIIRAVSAVERADVVIVVIDATEGVTEQDAKIAGIAHERGKGIIIAVNKWDAIEKDNNTVKQHTEKIRQILSFIPYAEILFISAKSGQRLNKIFELIDVVIENNSMRVATGVLNEIVTEAVAMQQPPTDKGKRLKIYYVTQVSVKPPTFVIFVNDKNLMHFSYTRYLENRIRDTFGFRGTALKFITRERKEMSKMILARILALVVGYFFGTFQTGYFYGKAHGIDVREHGSGNSGTTNTLRTLGWKAGAVTFFGDLFKAIIAVLIFYFIYRNTYPQAVKCIELYAGFGAVLGHNFPFFLNFKGGKGIACTSGVILAVCPIAAPICLVLFILAVAITRYVSLGSILVVISFLIQAIVFNHMGLLGVSGNYAVEFDILAACFTAMAIWRHRANIKRLLSGTENKFGQKAK